MNVSLLQNDHNALNHSIMAANNVAASLAGAVVFATNIFNSQCAYTSEARIGLTCDKPYYVAGELITGTITANVYLPLRATGIVLQCKGYEKVEWNEERTRQIPVHGTHHHHDHHHHHHGHHHHNSHHHNSHHTSDHHTTQYETEYYIKRFRGKQTFFAQTLRIYQMLDGILMPGTYTWPFQYQLPAAIPGSFYERRELTSTRHTRIEEDDNCTQENFYDSDDDCDGHDHHDHRKMPSMLAVVNYSLTATLDQNGMMRRDLRSKQPLIVHPRLGVDVQPSHGEKTSQVMLCCCIPRGECTVRADFDKNAYVPGETANIIAEVINGSTRPMRLAVRLVRTLILNARGRQVNGMSKRETTNVLEMRYADLKEKEHLRKTLTLPLPGNLKPSTHGSYVECSYTYVVEVQIAMAPDIEVYLPVRLYMPQPPPPPQPQMMMPSIPSSAPILMQSPVPIPADASAPPPQYSE